MLVTDEGQMRAACVMRDAADRYERAASSIEESSRLIQRLLDVEHGNQIGILIALLEDASRRGDEWQGISLPKRLPEGDIGVR
jgi:hypothetical protein